MEFGWNTCQEVQVIVPLASTDSIKIFLFMAFADKTILEVVSIKDVLAWVSTTQLIMLEWHVS